MVMKIKSTKCLSLTLVLAFSFFFISCKKHEQLLKPTIAAYNSYCDSIVLWDSLAVALMHSDSIKACNYATQSVSLAHWLRSDEKLIRALNVKGLVLFVNNNDSASIFFTNAMKLSDNTVFKNERSHIFYNLASLQIELNDYKSSIIMLDSAIRSGQQYRQPSVVAISLIAMASVYQTSEDTAKSRIFYDSALTISTRFHLNKEMGVALGNLARFQNNSEASKKTLIKSIQILNSESGAEEERANFLINLGLLQKNPDSAIGYYQNAIELSKKCRIPFGLVWAYYYLTYVYPYKKDVQTASEIILNKAIPVAERINNYDWLSTLYDTYADILIAKKRFSETVIWLRKSTQARAISDKIIAIKQVRLLNAVLEVKNKNLTILEAHQQIILRNEWINQLKFWLAIAGIVILVLTLGFLWYRQRNKNEIQQLKIESALKIIEAGEYEQEKNGMELHDALSMLSIKVKDSIALLTFGNIQLANDIQKHISDFATDVRNISHRMSRRVLGKHALTPLLINLCEENIKFGRLNLHYDIQTPSSEIPGPFALHIWILRSN